MIVRAEGTAVATTSAYVAPVIEFWVTPNAAFGDEEKL